MTAPHAVLKKFPPLGKPKSPGLAAVEIRDLSKHFGPATTVRAQDPVRLTGALERRGHRVDRRGRHLGGPGEGLDRSENPVDLGRAAALEILQHRGFVRRGRARSVGVGKIVLDIDAVRLGDGEPFAHQVAA